MLSTAGRWALQEHGPSAGRLETTAPRPSLTSISFPSFWESWAPPRARLSYFPETLARSLASLCVLLIMWAPRQPLQSRPAAGSLHAPFFLLAPAGRSCVLKDPVPGINWGRSGFLLRLSQEHYGWARSRLRPPAPASGSGAGTGGGEGGSASEEARARLPVRAQTCRRLSSHGRASRLRPRRSAGKSGVCWRAAAVGGEPEVLRARPRRRVGVATAGARILAWSAAGRRGQKGTRRAIGVM